MTTTGRVGERESERFIGNCGLSIFRCGLLCGRVEIVKKENMVDTFILHASTPLQPLEPMLDISKKKNWLPKFPHRRRGKR